MNPLRPTPYLRYVATVVAIGVAVLVLGWAAGVL